MALFIHPVLPSVFPSRPTCSHRIRLLCSHRPNNDRPRDRVPVDTLSEFEAFTWRAQEWLCRDTARADGLGTFTSIPSSPFYASFRATESWARERTRTMKGGRAFKQAIINVWRVAPSKRCRTRLTTVLNTTTGDVSYSTEAAGVSIKLEPRSLAAPALRADIRYFEVGGGHASWWFSGSADLCRAPVASRNAFLNDVRVIHEFWRNLCDRHGDFKVDKIYRDEITHFLNACLGGPTTQVSEDVLGRAKAFGFMTSVVDSLLPAYLPIVASRAEKEHYDRAAAEGAHNFTPFPGKPAHELVNNRFEIFKMEGGGRLETTFVKSAPLGLWRFNLTPPLRSPAGRVYQHLRNGRASANPFMYL